MKKTRIIVFALTLALSLGASAQTKFGLRAGANLVNMKISDGIDNLQGNNRAGFYVGPTVKFTLPIVGLGVDVSAVYDQRTSEVSAEGSSLYVYDPRGKAASAYRDLIRDVIGKEAV